MTSPFQILGISEQATVSEAAAAYRRLAKQYHPDRLQGRTKDEIEEAQVQFVEIQLAFEEVRALIESDGSASGIGRSSRPERGSATGQSQPTSPSANQVLKSELLTVLLTFDLAHRYDSIPIAFFVQRIRREALAREVSTSRLGVSPTDGVDVAALCLTMLILEPPTGPHFDSEMSLFVVEVAVMVLKRVEPTTSAQVREMVATQVPGVADQDFVIAEPEFCLLCLAQPARTITFKAVSASGFVQHRDEFDLHRCAACAEPSYRAVQSRQLAMGWWSPAGPFVTPMQLLHNRREMTSLRDAVSPQRERELTPPDLGPPIMRRLGSWTAPLVLLLLLAMVLVGVLGAQESSKTKGSAAKASVGLGTTSIPPVTTQPPPTTVPSLKSPVLGDPFASWRAAKGKPVDFGEDFGPMVQSAGGKVPTWESVLPADGPVESFTINFADGTPQDQVIAGVLANLPPDATTTYLKAILDYDNHRSTMFTECVAWDLTSPSMATAFARSGKRGMSTIAVTLHTSRNGNHSAGKRDPLRLPLPPVFTPGDGDYDSMHVTSAEVYAMSGKGPRNWCYVPETPDLRYDPLSY